MRLTGIEISNFRSIGSQAVAINPLKKCNILIGQNNSGKSNTIKAIKKISDRVNGLQPVFDNLDAHSRNNSKVFTYKLWFEADDPNSEFENNLIQCSGTSSYWFEISWQGEQPNITDFIFLDTKDFYQANQTLKLLTGRSWPQPVHSSSIQKEFKNLSGNIFSKFSTKIPPAFIVPEFRQIREGDQYSINGEGLIKLLAEYQSPPIGKDANQLKFEKIQNFARRLLQLPEAMLEFPRGDTTATIVVKNGDLRLPLSSFGTGAHELMILITAVLSQENAIWCIEEPEIHLHPRLQRDFIQFLISETNNQYFITTHSPTIINFSANNSEISIFHLTYSQGITTGGSVLNESEAIKVIQDLGLKPSDLMQANCIIWVEGISDRIFIKRWLELLEPNVLEGRDYIFMYYSSLPKLNFDTDKFFGELINVLRLNQNAVVVIDSDNSNEDEQLSKIKEKMKTQCEESGGLSWVTDGKEIENYITKNVIKKACNDLRNIEIELEIKPFDEFSQVLDKSIKSTGAAPLNYDKNKTSYSKKFSEHTTAEDISPILKKRLLPIIEKIKGWNS